MDLKQSKENSEDPLVVLEETDYRKVLLSSATRLKAQIFHRARNEFSCFARAVIKDEKTRQHIEPAKLHYEWFDHIERCKAAGKFAGILAPPESGKSQLFSVAYPLHSMGTNPMLRVAVACSDAKLAKKRVRPAKDYVQYDPDFKTIFPDCSPEDPEKWTEQEFTVRRPPGIKDPSYIGTGIERPPQGSRIDLLIADDITTYDNTISQPNMREKIIELWENGFMSRVGPESFAVYIAGIIHERDLSSMLTGDPRFWFIKQSVGSDFGHIVQEDLTSGKIIKLPLWDRAWNPQWLEQKYQANPRAFQRAYRHIGYSDDEKTFASGAVKHAITRQPVEPHLTAPIFLGVDLSGKNRKGNVIIAVQSLPNRKRRVLEVHRGAWSSNETAQHIISIYKRLRASAAVVENNAYQGALEDWINAVFPHEHINIVPFTTGKQKADETLGIPGLAAEFANALWEIPFEEDHVIGMGCHCGPCTLIGELIDHPFGDADTVMALWFCRFACMTLTYGDEIEFGQGRQIGRGVGFRQQGESRMGRFSRTRRGR